jgi:hypothetical protein
LFPQINAAAAGMDGDEAGAKTQLFAVETNSTDLKRNNKRKQKNEK